jgi:hypothetical protein
MDIRKDSPTDLPEGELIILDSDYRGGALFILLVTSVLLAYSIYCGILFDKIRRKPSQTISYSESVAMMTISIIISIFAGVAWIYAIAKLAINSEQRNSIYRNAVAFANKPAGGVPKSGRITPQRIDRRDVVIRRENDMSQKQEELNKFVPKRDIFVDSVFQELHQFNNPINASIGYT